MPYKYVLVDVFTDQIFGGNLLAVLPDARGLNSEQMQAIAREFSFAETAFVLPPADPANTARLRIFSPGAEMPFAGHPTVGSAAVISQLGLPGIQADAPILFEEIAGLVTAEVRTDGPAIYSKISLAGALDCPRERPDRRQLAAVLGLPADAVLDAWFASVGLRFCFCQLRSSSDVDAALLDKTTWTRVLKNAWAQHLFFFSGELADRCELYARMFAPAIGVDEDPATGSAAAVLAAVLVKRRGRGDDRVSTVIKQGVLLNRPSMIQAGASTASGVLQSVTVGGNVSFFATGTLSVSGVDHA